MTLSRPCRADAESLHLHSRSPSKKRPLRRRPPSDDEADGEGFGPGFWSGFRRLIAEAHLAAPATALWQRDSRVCRIGVVLCLEPMPRSACAGLDGLNAPLQGLPAAAAGGGGGSRKEIRAAAGTATPMSRKGSGSAATACSGCAQDINFHVQPLKQPSEIHNQKSIHTQRRLRARP